MDCIYTGDRSPVYSARGRNPGKAGGASDISVFGIDVHSARNRTNWTNNGSPALYPTWRWRWPAVPTNDGTHHCRTGCDRPVCRHENWLAACTNLPQNWQLRVKRLSGDVYRTLAVCDTAAHLHT